MAYVPKSIGLPRRRPGKSHHRHGAFGDLDYRDSAYAAKVTVEERGGLVIETRGRTCLGWRSSSHVSHNG